MSTTEILAELPHLTTAERSEVQAKLDELATSDASRRTDPRAICNDPAFGIWADRTDLPDDPVEAVAELRRQAARSRDVGRYADE